MAKFLAIFVNLYTWILSQEKVWQANILLCGVAMGVKFHGYSTGIVGKSVQTNHAPEQLAIPIIRSSFGGQAQQIISFWGAG